MRQEQSRLKGMVYMWFCGGLCSISVCWAQFCRAAKDTEGEVQEVNALVRVVHLAAVG